MVVMTTAAVLVTEVRGLVDGPEGIDVLHQRHPDRTRQRPQEGDLSARTKVGVGVLRLSTCPDRSAPRPPPRPAAVLTRRCHSWIRDAVAVVVLVAVSAALTALTIAYIASAFDPLNRNGGAFGVALALVLLGAPAAVSGWAAVLVWRRDRYT